MERSTPLTIDELRADSASSSAANVQMRNYAIEDSHAAAKEEHRVTITGDREHHQHPGVQRSDVAHVDAIHGPGSSIGIDALDSLTDAGVAGLGNSLIDDIPHDDGNHQPLIADRRFHDRKLDAADRRQQDTQDFHDASLIDVRWPGTEQPCVPLDLTLFSGRRVILHSDADDGKEKPA